ncbi:MAG TPA: hypothetical protein VNU68_20790 [Verrucomicrobiae bacterium]|nr:hypothetical protein [Verrucomicrobiae bacterium]
MDHKPATSAVTPHRKLGVGILLLLIGFVALLACLPTEPRYQGKKLSEWLVFGTESDEAMEQTSRALQSLGPKAIPCLLHWIQSKDSKPKQLMNALLDEQSWSEFRFRDADEWRELAIAGFAYLGEPASSTIPKLDSLIEDSEIGSDVFYALCYIGEPAVPNLLAAMNHRSAAVACARLKSSETHHS